MEDKISSSKKKMVGKFEVGATYLDISGYGGEKVFLQREDSVLMVNTSINLINQHEPEHLVSQSKNNGFKYRKIPREEFETLLRKCILELGIYEYCKSE
jgi:hypothetical protein